MHYFQKRKDQNEIIFFPDKNNQIAVEKTCRNAFFAKQRTIKALVPKHWKTQNGNIAKSSLFCH